MTTKVNFGGPKITGSALYTYIFPYLVKTETPLSTHPLMEPTPLVKMSHIHQATTTSEQSDTTKMVIPAIKRTEESQLDQQEQQELSTVQVLMEPQTPPPLIKYQLLDSITKALETMSSQLLLLPTLNQPLPLLLMFNQLLPTSNNLPTFNNQPPTSNNPPPTPPMRSSTPDQSNMFHLPLPL